MVKYGIGALAAVMLVSTAHAADLSPADIVHRHTAAVAKSDVDAMMADYAADAVVLEAGQALEGKAAIRALFERMFPPPVAGAPATGAAAMKIVRVWEEGHVGFVSWQMGPVNGTDSFLVRNGKIAVQAVFLNGAPPTPAQ